MVSSVWHYNGWMARSIFLLTYRSHYHHLYYVTPGSADHPSRWLMMPQTHPLRPVDTSATCSQPDLNSGVNWLYSVHSLALNRGYSPINGTVYQSKWQANGKESSIINFHFQLLNGGTSLSASSRLQKNWRAGWTGNKLLNENWRIWSPWLGLIELVHQDIWTFIHGSVAQVWLTSWTCVKSYVY